MNPLPPLLALAVSASSAHSAIIIGNLAAPTTINVTGSSNVTSINYTPATTGPPAASASYNAKAVGFTMGATDYSVDSITLRLSGVGNTGTDAPLVSIYTANAGKTAPSTLVGTFTNPTFTSTAITNWVFTPASGITLTAGASYFITVQQTNTTGSDLSFVWENGGTLTDNTNTVPTGVGATHDTARFGGGPLASAINSVSSRHNWYQLDGTAIPEPASALIAGLGAVLLGGRRRRG